MRLRFYTATPGNVHEGSGTHVGIQTLAAALAPLGVKVDIVRPSVRLPVFTAERLLFNEAIRFRRAADCDFTVGFDMDGYRIAGRNGPPHVAALKGVIADELRFETGVTRATMRIQARCEAVHVQRSALVLATSRYSSERARASYGVASRIVPELLDLARWQETLAANPPVRSRSAFVVLCVCRLYRRKRVDVLLRAAALLRDRTSGLDIRIVGDGPERSKLERLRRELRLEDRVQLFGHLPLARLASEYRLADIFCLPSVQEGFGIVLLEAMAAGKPIVAARAGAAPEVAPHALLAERDDPHALAGCIEDLYRDCGRRQELAVQGIDRAAQFDAPRVARLFLETISGAA